MLFKGASRQPVMSSDRNLVAKEQNRHSVTAVMARKAGKLGIIFLIWAGWCRCLILLGVSPRKPAGLGQRAEQTPSFQLFAEYILKTLILLFIYSYNQSPVILRNRKNFFIAMLPIRSTIKQHCCLNITGSIFL